MKTKGWAYFLVMMVFLTGAGSAMAITPGLFWDGVNNRIGINVANPQYTMDVVAPDTLLQFSSNETANTTKAARMVLRHYNNAQLPLYLLGGASTATNNYIAFGGGSPLGNAATQIDFFTAPNNTTPLGTSRLTIDSHGNVGIGTNTPAEKLEVNGGMALYTTDARPVCDVNSRGTFWFTQDDVIGDSAAVCAKVSSVYGWRNLF